MASGVPRARADVESEVLAKLLQQQTTVYVRRCPAACGTYSHSGTPSRVQAYRQAGARTIAKARAATRVRATCVRAAGDKDKIEPAAHPRIGGTPERTRVRATYGVPRGHTHPIVHTTRNRNRPDNKHTARACPPPTNPNSRHGYPRGCARAFRAPTHAMESSGAEERARSRTHARIRTRCTRQGGWDAPRRWPRRRSAARRRTRAGISRCPCWAEHMVVRIAHVTDVMLPRSAATARTR